MQMQQKTNFLSNIIVHYITGQWCLSILHSDQENSVCTMPNLTLAHFPLCKILTRQSESISSMALGCSEWFFNRKWTVRAAGIKLNVNSTQLRKCWSRKCGSKAWDFTLTLSCIYTDFRCQKSAPCCLEFLQSSISGLCSYWTCLRQLL